MEYLDIEFVLAEAASAETIERLFETAFEAGCHTERDGGNDHCLYETPDTEGIGSEEGATSDATAEIADLGQGGIHLYYGDYDEGLSSTLDFWLDVYRGTGEPPIKTAASSEDTPRVVIQTDAVHVASRDRPTESREAKSEDLVELAKTFYPVLQPIHVVGFRVWDVEIDDDYGAGPFQTEGVTVHEPLDWMAIFTPETVERIGTDWLDDVDPYRQERLDDGSLLVVLTPRPDMQSALAEKVEALEPLLDFSE